MKNLKDKIKSKVEKKTSGLKDKIKNKVNGKCGKCAAIAGLFALGLCGALTNGCATADPASRSNENSLGDIAPSVSVQIGEGACSNVVNVTVPVTIGDGLVASADSAGSTETQTATPTLDIRTKLDARYNDAMAAATPASKKVLGSLGEGLGAVLDMMVSKKTGTVAAKTADGKDVTIECKDGQCSLCKECEL